MLKDIVRSKTIKFNSMMSDELDVALGKNEFLNEKNNIVGTEDDSIFDEINGEGCDSVSAQEIADYIVENPNEVIVQFPIVSDVKLEEKLPFFRSIAFKLGGI